MAIFHLSMKTISRGRGQSATAAAAYRSGARIDDTREGVTHDYRRKRGIRQTGIIAPNTAPSHLRDREGLWNEAEQTERRRDAITAREVELALPRELSERDQERVVARFVQDEIVGRGLVADVSIHDSEAADGGSQPHAHILMTDRAVDPDRETGFAAKKHRDFSRRDGIEALRASWESHANRALERARSPERIDRRSLDAQRREAAQERSHAEAQAQAEGRAPEHDPDAADAAAKEFDASRPAETKAGPGAKRRRTARWSRVQRKRRIRERVRGLAASMHAAATEARQAEHQQAVEAAGAQAVLDAEAARREHRKESPPAAPALAGAAPEPSTAVPARDRPPPEPPEPDQPGRSRTGVSLRGERRRNRRGREPGE